LPSLDHVKSIALEIVVNSCILESLLIKLFKFQLRSEDLRFIFMAFASFLSAEEQGRGSKQTKKANADANAFGRGVVHGFDYGVVERVDRAPAGEPLSQVGE